MASRLGLASVSLLERESFILKELEGLVHSGRSAYRDGKLEGLVIRQDGPKWCKHRGKLVHDDFVQQIEEHWRSRAL
ncbi:hypothetical protein ACU8V3_12685 [Cobetia marina]